MIDEQEARRFFLAEAAYWKRCINSMADDVRRGETIRFEAFIAALSHYSASLESAKKCEEEAMLMRNYGHREP